MKHIANSSNLLDNLSSINNDLSKAGLPAVTTADKVGVKGQTKRQLAETSQKIMEWKGGFDDLDPENPGDWDDYAQKLKDIPGLTTPAQIILFRDMKDFACEKGVGYLSKEKRFFLLEVDPM